MKYIKKYINEEAKHNNNLGVNLSFTDSTQKIEFEYDRPYAMLLIYNDGHAMEYQENDLNGKDTPVDEPENVVEGVFNTEYNRIVGLYQGSVGLVFINKLTNLEKATFYKLSVGNSSSHLDKKCLYLSGLNKIKVLDLRTLNYADTYLCIHVANCESLEEVYFPDNVYLGKGNLGANNQYFGFNCPNLKKIVFGNNIAFIRLGKDISLADSDAEEIIFTGGINNKIISKMPIYTQDNYLQYYEQKWLSKTTMFKGMPYLKRLILPNNVLGLPVNLLYGTYIKELELPKSLKAIDFNIGGAIENVVIPNTIEYIAADCLQTKSTKSIKFNTDTESKNGKYTIVNNCIIENNAHYLIKGCADSVIPDSVLILGLYSLTSITSNIFTIPSNIKEIRTSCFDSANINYLILKATVPPTLECTIPNTVKNIVVPVDALETYKTATNWVNYANKIIAPTDTILTLEDNSQVTITGTALTKEQISDVYASTLKSVSIGIGVTSIGNETFKDCTKLNHLEGGATVKTIGDNAFENCSELHYYTGFNSLESLGSNVFKGVPYGQLYVTGLLFCSVKDDTFPSTWYDVSYDPAAVVVNPNIVDEYKADPVWSQFGNNLQPVLIVTDTIINSLNLGGIDVMTDEELSSITNTITSITLGNMLQGLYYPFDDKKVSASFAIPKDVNYVQFGSPESWTSNQLTIKNTPSNDVYQEPDPMIKFNSIKLYVTNPAEVGSNVISMLKDNGTLMVPREGYNAFKEAFPNITVSHFNPNIE